MVKLNGKYILDLQGVVAWSFGKDPSSSLIACESAFREKAHYGHTLQMCFQGNMKKWNRLRDMRVFCANVRRRPTFLGSRSACTSSVPLKQEHYSKFYGNLVALETDNKMSAQHLLSFDPWPFGWGPWLSSIGIGSLLTLDVLSSSSALSNEWPFHNQLCLDLSVSRCFLVTIHCQGRAIFELSRPSVKTSEALGNCKLLARRKQ